MNSSLPVYIDYSLAQICAFQFWKRMNEDYVKAWTDYLKLCRAVGSRSFIQLVAEFTIQSWN
jgi:oligoendopeptidase F